MTSQLIRREHAVLRAQRERDALLQVIADADLNVALKLALEHGTNALYDEVHLVVTMGDEPVYPTEMSKLEAP